MKGIVFPAKWDGDGKVLKVLLDTMDHGQYYIENEGAGKALSSLLSCEVDVDGTVEKDESGNIILGVRRYCLVEDSEEEMAA